MYLCLVDTYKSKGYRANNHFRKHMLEQNFHVDWNNHGCPKKHFFLHLAFKIISMMFLSWAMKWQWNKKNLTNKIKNSLKKQRRLGKPWSFWRLVIKTRIRPFWQSFWIWFWKNNIRHLRIESLYISYTIQ